MGGGRVDLGDLVLEKELGRGAQTAVFQARRGSHRYALKLLRSAAADAPDALVALRREAALLACVQHPGVVRSHAAGLYEGRPALVTELVLGSSLAQLLALGPLPSARVLTLAEELATALAAAHRSGLVHRDLKPHNVMVPADGPAKLIDFGLATHTSRGADDDSVAGTFVYTAPEQTGMLKRPVDERSDLYSLGVVLFECVTGRPPFLANDVGELLRMHAAVPAPDVRGLRPDADDGLARVIGRLLGKDPDDRYRNARELLADLRRCGAGGDAAAVPEAGDWPLCGRGSELSTLAARWAKVHAGSGGVALVHGPAGGGKSHLVRAVAMMAQRTGSPVLAARCTSDSVPLAALREALERHLDDVGARPAPERAAGRERIRAAAAVAGAGVLATLSPALAALLDSAPTGTPAGSDDQFLTTIAVFLCELARRSDGALLSVDDAQWLDATSRQVLTRLAAQLPTAPLLVLLSAPDADAADPVADTAAGGDDTAADPVAALRADCGAALDTEIAVGVLPDAAVAELIATRLAGAAVTDGLTAHVTARTGGFPLAVVEYLHTLVDSGVLAPAWGTWDLDTSRLDTLTTSASGLDLLVSRVEELPAEDRAVLVVAATVGNRFRLDVVADAAERSPARVAAAVAAAVARRLVEPRGSGRYGFVHPGLRDVLSNAAGTDLHRRIAQALDRLDDAARDPEHVYAVARHYARGGDGDAEPLFRSLVAAGRQALADRSPNDAISFLEQAERAAAAASLPVHADVHHSLAIGYLRMGRFAEAHDRIRRALDGEPDPWRRARLWSTQADLHSIAYADDQAVTAATTALAELGHAIPPNRIRLIVSSLGTALAAALVRRTGIGFGTVRGRRREEYLTRAALLDAGAYGCLVGMRVKGAAVYVMRALYLVNRLGEGPLYAKAYALLGYLLALVRLRRPADRCFDRAARVAADLADPVLIAYVDWIRGTGMLFGGHDDGQMWHETVEKHARWLAPAQLLGGFSVVCLRLLLRGRAVDAEAAYERCRALLPVGEQVNGSSFGMLRVMVPALRGHSAEAAAALAALRASFADGSGTVQQRANVAVAALHSLVEQGEFGAPFDAAVAEFEAIGMRRSEMMSNHKWYYVFLVHGRLGQCRLASPEERPARIAAARAALRELKRTRDTPLLKAAYDVAAAALLIMAGKPKIALKVVDRAEQRARPLDAPAVSLEAARIRARVLRRMGLTGEAERQARWAHLIATLYGMGHRAQQIRAEFDLGELTASRYMPVERGTRDSARNRRLEALQQVSVAAATVLDPKQLTRVALTETLRILGAERALFFIVDDDGTLRPYVGLDANGADLDAMTGYGSSLVRRVRDTGEPLIVTGTEEGAALGSRSVVAHGLRSIMVAPVQLKGRTLAVVYLDSRMARGIFTDDDIDVLTAVTSQVAVSLETARAAQLELAVRTARQQQELAETLRTSLAELSAILDPHEVLHRLAATLARHSGAERGCLLRADGTHLTVTAMTGAPIEAGYGRQFDLTVDVRTAELAHAPQIVSGTDSTAPPAVADLLDGPEAWMSVPLRGRNGLVGLVLLGGTGFGDAQGNVAAALAGQGMSAYDNAQLFSQVQQLATVDGLTGIANRRHFYDMATALFGVARRNRRQLAAAMVDIDHFKKINDRYGHAVGDDVIREVAARLAGAVRASDVLGRYGGEEFSVLLPEAGDISTELAERMRTVIAAEPVQTRGGPVPVTISVGLAWRTADDDILDTLLARADHALYQAKAAGRNRVATG